MSKPKKTTRIFDQVLNRSFDVIQPEDGLEPIRIEMTGIANIPGVIRHLSCLTQRLQSLLFYPAAGWRFTKSLETLSSNGSVFFSKHIIGNQFIYKAFIHMTSS